jgi:hypothetical protein
VREGPVATVEDCKMVQRWLGNGIEGESGEDMQVKLVAERGWTLGLMEALALEILQWEKDVMRACIDLTNVLRRVSPWDNSISERIQRSINAVKPPYRARLAAPQKQPGANRRRLDLHNVEVIISPAPMEGDWIERFENGGPGGPFGGSILAALMSQHVHEATPGASPASSPSQTPYATPDSSPMKRWHH